MVASGDENGVVKLWDVGKSKMIHQFTCHTDRVAGLVFNPSLLEMATCSGDRTVRFYDLEPTGMRLLQSCVPDTKAPRAISYDPSGSALISATQNGVKTWSTTQSVCHDVHDVDLRTIKDMQFTSSGQVVLCSINTAQTFVVINVVNPSLFRPLRPATPPVGAAAATQPRTLYPQTAGASSDATVRREPSAVASRSDQTRLQCVARTRRSPH
jgi:WD40 repeat protein